MSGTVEYIKCVGREDEGTEEEAQYTVARVEKAAVAAGKRSYGEPGNSSTVPLGMNTSTVSGLR